MVRFGSITSMVVVVLMSGVLTDAREEILNEGIRFGSVLESRSTDSIEPLALHGVRQINRSLRSLNLALGFELEARMSIQHMTDALNHGCQTVQKLSPGFNRDFDTTVEELKVSFLKCQSEPASSTEALSGVLNGADHYTIVYDRFYPRAGDPNQVLGYPLHLSWNIGPIKIHLVKRDGVQLELERSGHVTATRIGASNDMIQMRLSGFVTDQYTVLARGTRLRWGEVVTEFTDFSLNVSRDRTRRITGLRWGAVQIHKHGQKSSRSSPDRADVELVATGDWRVAAGECDFLFGGFEVSESGLHPLRYEVRGAVAQLISEENSPRPRSIESCQSGEDVYFAHEIADLLL